MAGPTIAAGYPKALFEFAVARGADRRRLVERSGLDPAALGGQDARVPLEPYIALLDAAAELTGDPALALKFGEAVPMADVSMVGLIGQTAETVGEAGEQIRRYHRLIIDDHGVGLDVVRGPEGVWLVHTGAVFARHPRLTETSFARSIVGARALLGATPYFQANRFPRQIRFTHEAPGYLSEYERVFDVPMSFGAGINGFQVDEAFLAIRIPTTNRYVFGVFSEKAQALLDALECSDTVRGQVERALAAVLHKGRPRIGRVAAGLGMSRQTLFRRLRAEGTTFEAVLDALRRRLAEDYLSARKVSVNETAYLTGFSDPAAFSRAFKRWTGVPPKAFREGGR